ncbi:MAG TPA: hypothetical protein VIV11_43460 [Kofleriaceae bacterium]
MAKPRTVIWIAALALALAACKGKKQDTTPKNTGGAASKVDASLCDESSKRVATFDLNKDGKADVWHLYAGDVETCKIDDFDHDGNKDFMIAYDKSKQPVYKKADVDWDGKFDMIEVFENGTITEAERDSDFDGKLDVKEIYAAGTLQSVRRDRNGDNKPDQWEQYIDGAPTQITYDDNFDGKVDRRDDNPGGPPQAQAPAPAPAPTTTPPVTAPATPAPADKKP